MSSFNLTFPRAVILASLLGSAVLAYFDFQWSARLDELTRQTERTVPERVRAIQEHSLQLDQLQEQLDDDKWTGQNNPGSYVRAIAQDDNVRLGQVDVTPSNPENLGNGIVDQKYVIKPVDKDRGWSKDNIGNFVYLLEEQSPRVRVTRIEIQPPPGSRPRPHELPRDSWTYEVEITSRQREE